MQIIIFSSKNTLNSKIECFFTLTNESNKYQFYFLLFVSIYLGKNTVNNRFLQVTTKEVILQNK